MRHEHKWAPVPVPGSELPRRECVAPEPSECSGHVWQTIDVSDRLDRVRPDPGKRAVRLAHPGVTVTHLRGCDLCDRVEHLVGDLWIASPCGVMEVEHPVHGWITPEKQEALCDHTYDDVDQVSVGTDRVRGCRVCLRTEVSQDGGPWVSILSTIPGAE